ncbi:MAG: protein phosphatase CheZ [Burkholderiales bacterium PBB4]|nr:MAG: protein phosphatase CheZ [Burkholderiales bacterium PBB4]
MSTPITKEEAFARLGSITREMHEALSVLGGNQLHAIVEEMPNARDRLAHVGKMTEEAANKVLNLVDKAKPECDDLSKRGVELGQSIAKMAASEDLSVERARALMGLCGKFAERTAAFASGQADVLSDIMMAQDFQDLSGQVIKKVIDIISRTEMQLVQLLVDSAPQSVKEETEFTGETHQLQGPQSADAALAQGDVDDLLASLGF